MIVMVVVTIYVFLSVVAAALSQRYGCNKNMDLIEHGIIGLFWPLAAVFFVHTFSYRSSRRMEKRTLGIGGRK